IIPTTFLPLSPPSLVFISIPPLFASFPPFFSVGPGNASQALFLRSDIDLPSTCCCVPYSSSNSSNNDNNSTSNHSDNSNNSTDGSSINKTSQQIQQNKTGHRSFLAQQAVTTLVEESITPVTTEQKSRRKQNRTWFYSADAQRSYHQATVLLASKQNAHTRFSNTPRKSRAGSTSMKKEENRNNEEMKSQQI
ncbi:hypothetical protein FHG87_021524, partial [Trinorchestia longiramus]